LQVWTQLHERLAQERDGKLATNGAELEAERGARRQACGALEGLQQKVLQQGDALGKQARLHIDKLLCSSPDPAPGEHR